MRGDVWGGVSSSVVGKEDLERGNTLSSKTFYLILKW